MVERALACGRCGEALALPGVSDTSACVHCGAEHRSGPSSKVLAVARPSWHDGEDAARIPLTEDAVLDLVRQDFADVDSICVYPHVPTNTEHAARRAHVAHLPPHERILALYETSVLDATIHEGFGVTAMGVCWENPGERARSIEWRDLDADRLYLDGRRLFLGDDAIVLTATELQDACANAFHVLALSGLPPRPVASGRAPAHDIRPAPENAGERGRLPRTGSAAELTLDLDELEEALIERRDTTPPPPHTTSFFTYASHARAQAPDRACWSCHTPLYETTPQCAFCGAEPTPTGWLTTGS